MLIRQETSNDYATVYNLVKLAFETAEHSDGNEHSLVNALREGDAFVPELSLIAEVDGQIAGHIMSTEGIPSANFMAIKLTEDAEPIKGAVAYAKEFGM